MYVGDRRNKGQGSKTKHYSKEERFIYIANIICISNKFIAVHSN